MVLPFLYFIGAVVLIQKTGLIIAFLLLFIALYLVQMHLALVGIRAIYKLLLTLNKKSRMPELNK